MAHSVLRKIASTIRAHRYFSIIVDEATDCSFKEQVSICLRHVSPDTLQVHEDLFGLYETEKSTAEILTKIIKYVLCRLGLDLNDCRVQAYDSASNMSGRLSVVQVRISADFPKAFFLSLPKSCSSGLLKEYSVDEDHPGYNSRALKSYKVLIKMKGSTGKS